MLKENIYTYLIVFYVIWTNKYFKTFFETAEYYNGLVMQTMLKIIKSLWDYQYEVS